jgi:hypothetical protein
MACELGLDGKISWHTFTTMLCCFWYGYRIVWDRAWLAVARGGWGDSWWMEGVFVTLLLLAVVL